MAAGPSGSPSGSPGQNEKLEWMRDVIAEKGAVDHHDVEHFINNLPQRNPADPSHTVPFHQDRVRMILTGKERGAIDAHDPQAFALQYYLYNGHRSAPADFLQKYFMEVYEKNFTTGQVAPTVSELPIPTSDSIMARITSLPAINDPQQRAQIIYTLNLELLQVINLAQEYGTALTPYLSLIPDIISQIQQFGAANIQIAPFNNELRAFLKAADAAQKSRKKTREKSGTLLSGKQPTAVFLWHSMYAQYEEIEGKSDPEALAKSTANDLCRFLIKSAAHLKAPAWNDFKGYKIEDILKKYECTKKLFGKGKAGAVTQHDVEEILKDIEPKHVVTLVGVARSKIAPSNLNAQFGGMTGHGWVDMLEDIAAKKAADLMLKKGHDEALGKVKKITDEHIFEPLSHTAPGHNLTEAEEHLSHAGPHGEHTEPKGWGKLKADLKADMLGTLKKAFGSRAEKAATVAIAHAAKGAAEGVAEGLAEAATEKAHGAVHKAEEKKPPHK